MHICYINAFEALVKHSRIPYLFAHMELTAAPQTYSAYQDIHLVEVKRK